MDSRLQVLKTLNKPALLTICSTLGGSQAEFDSRPPIVGSGYASLIINFPVIGSRWVARVPLDQEHVYLEPCVQPLEYIARTHPALLAPHVHGYHDITITDRENPAGVGYMLVDWIDGVPLPPWNWRSPPVLQKQKVLRQIAQLMLELLTSPVGKNRNILFYGVPDGTPEGTQVSTTTWLTESVDRGLRRTLLGNNKRADPLDYLIQRSMIPRYVVKEHEDSPWVFCHGDLHGGNMIFDEEFNIRGVIDWDYTFATPLQKAATFPKLLENVPGGAPPDVPEELAYVDLSEDKSLFLAIFKEMEQKRTGETKITNLIATSRERNFFEISLHCPSVHKEFVGRFCHRTRENLDAASDQLGKFVIANGVDRNDEAILAMEDRLDSLRQESASSS